jgi:holo-[acyl-carrier protein] synthase
MINQRNSAKDIIGIGVDLVEIERFKDVLKKHDNTFKKRIFTPIELEYCESRADPAIHLAARFCAKEALSKALGTGIGKNLRFLDIQTTSLENKKPILELINNAKEHFNNPSFDLSISHTDSMATAFVIAYS